MTALPTVFLIGGEIIEIAIAGVFIVYFLGQSSFGVKWSAESFGRRAGPELLTPF